MREYKICFDVAIHANAGFLGRKTRYAVIGRIEQRESDIGGGIPGPWDRSDVHTQSTYKPDEVAKVTSEVRDHLKRIVQQDRELRAEIENYRYLTGCEPA